MEPRVQSLGLVYLGCTHRPLSSSCLGLPYRVRNINHKKELLRGLWIWLRVQSSGYFGVGFEGTKVQGSGRRSVGSEAVCFFDLRSEMGTNLPSLYP